MKHMQHRLVYLVMCAAYVAACFDVSHTHLYAVMAACYAALTLGEPHGGE
ncbi:hypothetical protein IB270_26410 [Ensifer sp. ENS05]|nr:hypothetical protein [Ensifer sp. ENS05]MBD9596377.1 hypothetical protein [Ensifer sp. ENS05]